MMNRQLPPLLCLDAGSLLVDGFKSMQACCKPWLRHPRDRQLLSRQPCRLRNHPLASQPLRTSNIHRALRRPDTPQPATSHPAQPARAPGLAAALALQRLPGSPRQEPAGSPGTGLLCAQREGRRFRQMPPVKIAAGIANARRGPLIVGNNSMLKWVNYGEKKKK